jgi:hypothetical protein
MLVEHLLQHSAKLGFVEDRGEPAACIANFSRVVDGGDQFRARLEEPLEPLPKLGVLRHQSPVERRRRA